MVDSYWLLWNTGLQTVTCSAGSEIMSPKHLMVKDTLSATRSKACAGRPIRAMEAAIEIIASGFLQDWGTIFTE